MPKRPVIATATDPNKRPREGLAVLFAAPEGHDSVVALTDPP